MLDQVVLSIELRNMAFYLIKKYSSYRHLYVVYELQKEFVDAFEQQLRHPPQSVQQLTELSLKNREKEFITFLGDLDYVEKGLKELLSTKLKKEAYELFFQGDIQGQIFGRYGDENGLVDNVFYQNLGLGQSYDNIFQENDYTRFILKLLIATEMIFGTSITLRNGVYYIQNNFDKSYKKWSYESLLLKKDWPPCKQIIEPVIPFPDYNKNSNDQIHTGEEIQISGIYEPWFEKPVYQKLTNDPEYNMYVGCPNYFLEGSEATQYKLEGTDDWYDVKWRLIWEDKRYLDGTIPEEEKNYIFEIENIGKAKNEIDITSTVEKLSVWAGKASPKTGYWITTAKSNSRQYFKQGEIFPNFESDWGDVYWQFDGEE